MKTRFRDPPDQIEDLKSGLLMFYFGNEHLYSVLWAPSGAVCTTKIMPCEEIAGLVAEFQVVLDPYSNKQKASSAFNRFIFEWGPRLVPDAGTLADYHLLTIIPHRILNGLPFHGIWIEPNERYLGTTHGIAYCSSATLLLRCADRNLHRQHGSSSTEAAWLPPQCITVAADVVGNHQEDFTDIAAEFSKYFTKGSLKYSTRFFKHQLVRSPLAPVCIVCHGYVDKEQPTSSGLMLDIISRDVDDHLFDPFILGCVTSDGVTIMRDHVERPIFIDENCDFIFRDLPFRETPLEFESEKECEAMTVDELNLDVETSASLVALFACHSAAGNISAGDDYTSFAYQWLKVGAVSVLANCWEADVEVIKEFSSRFMAYWASKRRPKAVAFRLALRDYIASHPEKTPLEWAVVSLFGDWL